MSQVFKGFIAKIGEKSGRGKTGRPWTLYSIKLEKEDGTEYDKWISAGFNKPEAKEGDYVKIEATENDKGYLNIDSLKRLKNAPARSGKTASKGSAADGHNAKGTAESIHYQSARKDAIEVIGILLAQDALPLSSAKTKAGEAKRYEELMALVDKLTVRYFQDTQSFRILESVTDEGAAETDVGSLPEDSDEDTEETYGDDDEEESDDDSDDE